MSDSNIAKKIMQVEPGSLHAGVDLALDENLAVVIDGQARRWDRFRFDQDAHGYRYFLDRLEKVRMQSGASQVIVAMEPTNYFWKLLAQELERQNLPYHLVNSYTVKKHREGDLLDRSKDDPRDGFMIADLSRTGKHTETRLQHGIYADLRQYATLYYQVTKAIDRELSMLSGLAGQVFPELRSVFKEMDGLTIRAILSACPAAASIRQLSEAAFVDRVKAAFTGQRLPLKRLLRVYQRAQTSVGLTEGLKAYQHAIHTHLNLWKQLETEKQAVTQALFECLKGIEVAPYLASIPGVHPLWVALLLAEIGDPAAYTSASQLIKLAGTQPTPNASGRKQRSRTPMSHLGRGRLRYLLYWTCLNLVQVNPDFKRRYQELQTRPKNALTKMQALGVLMNKLLRVSWALMSQKVLYDPALTVGA